MRGPFRARWNAASDCSNPVYREIKGLRFRNLPTGRHEKYQQEARELQNPMAYLDMWVPCRRCGPCLRRKAKHWKLRAMSEIGRAHRTWFCTFTLRPEEQSRVELELRSRIGNEEVHRMSPEQRTTALAKAAGQRITLWLKRVRENSGAAVRYVVVSEAHKSGLPHFHALLHECEQEKPVSWRTLSHAWTWGFSQFKLVREIEKNAASYVTKYIAKHPLTRVRGSVGYGQGDQKPLGIATKGKRERVLTPATSAASQHAPPMVAVDGAANPDVED